MFHTKQKNVSKTQEGYPRNPYIFMPIKASCEIWYAYIKEQRLTCPQTNSWKKYNFDIKANCQGHSEGVDVRDRLSHGDTLMCKIWNDNIKGETNCGPI